MHIKKNAAFTLMELMIVVVIISLITVATILLLDPRTIVDKGVDAQRKSDLNSFKKKAEEFYNDKGCYPKLSEICFSGGVNGDVTNKTSCIMCGTESTSPSFTPYIDRLPCDPRYPFNVYLYAINSSASVSEKACPKSFTLYSKLSVLNDSDAIKLGCGENGCGPGGSGYDFGVSSPNVIPKTTSSFLCLTIGGSCDNCSQPGYPSNYEGCLSNSNCQKGAIYASYAACISANPGAH